MDEWLSTVPVAHRGLHSTGVPENSLAAFAAAADAGYAIELDIHLSSDGEIVVFHDDTTVRLTGADHKVTATSAAVLTALSLDGTPERIPLLREVLDLVAGRVPLLIEIKTGTPPALIGRPLLALLQGYAGAYAVQSFDPRIVFWLRRNAPGVTRGQISGSFVGDGVPFGQRILLRSMVLNAVTWPDFLAFQVDALPSVVVALWRRVLKAPLLVWTVRDPGQLRAAQRFRANPIFESVVPQ